MTDLVRLPNPVPYEAVMQFVRHLTRIQQALGFHYSIEANMATNQPGNMETVNVNAQKNAVVNVSWDIDECLDAQPDLRVNGQANYRSTCFLNCYLFSNTNPHKARTDFHADLHRYFFNREDQSIGFENWTLKNPNGQKVVRELYVTRLNTVLTSEKKPMIQVDIEVTLWWAALNHDLNYPM